MRLCNLLILASGTSMASLAREPLGADDRDRPIVRDGTKLLLNGKPWRMVGPNIYWLGLDENVTPPAGEPYHAPLRASYPTKGRITDAIATVRALGGTMIRSHTLGVSTGNPLSLMPSLGEINEAAFEAIDFAVWQARQYGLRLLVPLTDNFDYYHGGKYNFLRWHGLDLRQNPDSTNPQVQRFYTDPKIVSSFKSYVAALLTHRNPLTNLTYAEDPTIFAYETGNELCGPVWGDMDVPRAWVSEVGRFVKGLAPEKLFVDGTYGVNRTHLDVGEVDVFSDHFYPVSLSKLRGDLELVASANKTYFAGEYDWTGARSSTGDADLAAWFQVLEESPVAVGDSLWSLFGRNLPDCKSFVDHADGLTMHYGNPTNSATTVGRIRLIRQHWLRWAHGVEIDAEEGLPEVACPAPEKPVLLVSEVI